MITDIATRSLLEEFNSFFKGSAEVVVNGNRLEITINNMTLMISLPEIVGAQSGGPVKLS